MKAVLVSALLLLHVLPSSTIRISYSLVCQRQLLTKCISTAVICVQVAQNNMCELRRYTCAKILAICRANRNVLISGVYQLVNRNMCRGSILNQRRKCRNGLN